MMKSILRLLKKPRVFPYSRKPGYLALVIFLGRYAVLFNAILLAKPDLVFFVSSRYLLVVLIKCLFYFYVLVLLIGLKWELRF